MALLSPVTTMPAILPDSLIIEVCVDSIQSAVAAVKAGADRLEICGNLSGGGGTTPSIGLIKAIQHSVDVPLMVMIRPRVGDFLYSKEELVVMLEDIRTIKELGGVRGFVVGALTKDGSIDVECMKSLVDEILPLEICFHRAFDMSKDPTQATADITDIGGISRILTSGHRPNVSEGLPILKSLFKTKNDFVDDDTWGLTIMPGSGINGKTLPALLHALLPLGLKEIHLSGGKWTSSEMLFKKDDMGMGSLGNEWAVWCTQEDEIRKVREVADAQWKTFVFNMVK